MQLKEIKNVFHKELDEIYPKEEVDSFFFMLIEFHLKLERFVLVMEPNIIVSKQEEQPLFEALSLLKKEHPIQHIIGKAHFMDMDFKVTPDVLIPRPETEDLVRWIIEEVQRKKREVRNRKEFPIKILDIGTGSGCIAIALAKNLPNAQLTALDISDMALETAKTNAHANKVEIEFVQADILELKTLGTKFDIIVSNPPYVREQEKKQMHANVLRHEPELALYVSNDNPLVFYEQITRFAKENLRTNGNLFFEINQYLGKETKQLLQDHNFSEIELRKDIFGNDRMLKGIFIK